VIDARPICLSSQSNRKFAADLIEVAYAAIVLLIPGGVIEREICSAQADKIDFAMQPSLRRVAHLI